MGGIPPLGYLLTEAIDSHIVNNSKAQLMIIDAKVTIPLPRKLELYSNNFLGTRM